MQKIELMSDIIKTITLIITFPHQSEIEYLIIFSFI